nr:hypothetical protein [Neorhizobium tomejilense]
MLKSLSETGAEEMRAVSALLQELQDKTDSFTSADLEHFECKRSSGLLLAGKGLSCSGSSEENWRAWHGSEVPFEHARAAGEVVAGVLRTAAARIVEFALEETAALTDVFAEWIVEHPFTFPVFVNASGTRSKNKFKAALSLKGASDRAIGPTDAARIVANINPEAVLPAREIIAAMEGLIEGIVRDQIGKVVNEDFARRALDKLGLEYVRDEGGARKITGVFMESRSDFALPCNVAPRVIVDVRKSSSQHSAHYASDLSNCIADKITKHSKALAVFLYDGAWTGPAMDRLEKAYDWVFHVHESAKAADIIKRHMGGEDMRKLQRIYYTHVEPDTQVSSDIAAHEMAAFAVLYRACEAGVSNTKVEGVRMAQALAVAEAALLRRGALTGLS